MSSSLRRGVTAAVIAFPLAALAACGAGSNAATSEVRPNNAYAHVEDIKIQNVVVIRPEGEGPAGISARLFNTGGEEQTLEAIRVPGTGETVELSPAEGGEGGIVVPAGGDVALGGEGNPSAVIADPAAGGIALGNAQRLVFELSETGGITLFARVVGDTDNFDHYAEWGPTPTATPTSPEEEAEEPEPGTEDDTATDETTDEATDEAATDGTEETVEDGSEDLGDL